MIKTRGELKDRNRWEGGVAYILTPAIHDKSIEKSIRLRFHGRKPEVRIIEPFIENKETRFKQLDENTVEILGGAREFVFELLADGHAIEIGADEERYQQPFPALKGYPITIKVNPDADTFVTNITYRIAIRGH